MKLKKNVITDRSNELTPNAYGILNLHGIKAARIINNNDNNDFTKRERKTTQGDTWALSKLNRLDLQIGPKITVDQTREKECCFFCTMMKLTFPPQYSTLEPIRKSRRFSFASAQVSFSLARRFVNSLMSESKSHNDTCFSALERLALPDLLVGNRLSCDSIC